MSEQVTIQQPFGISSNKVNIPSDGEVYRSGDRIFKREGNKLISLGGGRIVSTDLRLPDGSILKQGTFITDAELAKKLGPEGAVTPVDSRFRGAHFQPISAKAVYEKEYGKGSFDSLPEYNAGDLAQVASTSDILESGSAVEGGSLSDYDPAQNKNLTSAAPQQANVGAEDITDLPPGIDSPLAPSTKGEVLPKATDQPLAIKQFETPSTQGSEKFFIQSGTGAQLTEEQIRQGDFPEGTFFIESGTGNKVTKEDLGVAPPAGDGTPPPAGGDTGVTDDATAGAGDQIGTEETQLDFTDLENSPEFQALTDDQKGIVKAVFEGIANNDVKLAQAFAEALKTAEAINDPFFSSMLRLASDAINRGFVSLENEEAFKEQQLRNNLADLEVDIANQQEFLSLEEQNILRGVERLYKQNLETTRQNLAVTGFTQSTRRAEKEELLGAEREDIVESTERKFAFQQEQQELGLKRGERDVGEEITRLAELAQEGRLDLLRQAEAELGTGNLAGLTALAGGAQPLGDIGGRIPREKTESELTLARALTF